MVLLHCAAAGSSLLSPDGEGKLASAGSSLHRCSQSPPGKIEMRKDVDCRRGGHCCSSLEERQGRHCSAREEPELPSVEAAQREPELPPEKKFGKIYNLKKFGEI
nr:hypothetical protein Itr_chr08CG07300 [Ipomoea trifida]